MLAGSLFGVNTPGAKPWRYDMDGKPRARETQAEKQPKKRTERDSR
jgi:hypothetical protein